MKCSWQVYSLLLCGSVMIGCGESTDSTVSDSAPAAAPATAAAPVEKAPSDPLLDGIEFDDPEEFPKALSAYEAAPTDVAAVEKYSQVLLSMAWAHAQGGNAELSNEAITRAGKIILKANSDGVALPVAPESMLQAEILFGYACVQSSEKKGAESLATLQAAVKSGFSNLEILKNDKDLEFTRTLPEFATQLATWEAAHEAEVIATAKADLEKGETFPFDFQLTDVNGKTIQLGDYKLGKSRHPEGQICVVDIWGTWCPPCRQEVPMFIKLQDKYGKFGLQMIGLNDERGLSPEANVSTVKNFMANTSMNYPCAIITPEVMEQVPEFKGFPTTLFIDHHGKVRHMAFGFHEYKYMETIVETLLSERTREARTAATN